MMKISKCKKELARIISEHGGWRNGEFAAHDGNGGVGGYGEKPVWSLLCKYWRNEAFGEWFVANKIKNHHQTVLSRAEYFHLYPSASGDGWIEWKGGECPVGEGDRIDVKFSGGDTLFGVNSGWDWGKNAGCCNIIAYRLHKPEQALGELCGEAKEENKHEHIDAKPTIEQLAADYRSKLDYANRKQDEADKANMESDAALSQLEDAIAAIGFVITPLAATEKEPELVITDWRDLQVDDVIELTGSVNPCWEEHSGSEMTVKEVYRNQGDNDDQVDLLGGSGRWSLGGNSTWRFIRRP